MPFVVSDDAYASQRDMARRNRGKRVLGRALAEPVRPEDEDIEYIPTQFLARMIANLGLDGAAYASSQRAGRRQAFRGNATSNFLFFDPDVAVPTGDLWVFTVEAVRYACALARKQ